MHNSSELTQKNRTKHAEMMANPFVLTKEQEFAIQLETMAINLHMCVDCLKKKLSLAELVTNLVA